MPVAYGKPFVGLTAGYHPYSPDTPPPACGNSPVSYKEMAGNAFYCPAGDFIAFDDYQLFPELNKEFGNFTLALVLAHEWGHGIQERANITGPTVYLEQQADCFAGAWAGWVNEGKSADLTLRAGNLDTALGGFLKFRDEPGTAATDPQAHGSGFDRVTAFQDGFENGAVKCSHYDTEAPPIVELPFSTTAEASANGNIPVDEAIALSQKTLNAYWSDILGTSFVPVDSLIAWDPAGATLPKCGDTQATKEQLTGLIGYCPTDNTVLFDITEIKNIYNATGDFGVAAVLAEEWARAAQSQTKDAVEGKEAELQRDCFSGTWAGWMIAGKGGAGTELSPGDLDEAIQAFIRFSGSQGGTNASGVASQSAFDKVTAFRKGVLGTETNCVALYPNGPAGA